MGKLKNIFYKVDWPLLLFLVGITYVKLYVKLAAVVLYACYMLYKKALCYKFNRIHYFYTLIAVFASIVAVYNGSIYKPDYQFAFAVGTVQWLIALSGAYLVYISVVNKRKEEVLQLFKAFFAINALISFGALISIIIEMKGLFPYWASSLKYGVSTGDHIRGVFGDSSVANATVCAMGALYFLRYRAVKWSLLCMVIMLLCTSNITVLLFLLVLVGLLVMGQAVRKRQVATVLVATMLLYPVLSIQNMSYIKLMILRVASDDYMLGLEKLLLGRGDVTLIKDRQNAIYNPYYDDLRHGNLKALLKTNTFYGNDAPVDRPVFAPQEFYANIDKYRASINGSRRNLSGEVWSLKTGDKLFGLYGYTLDPLYVRQGKRSWYKDSTSYIALRRSGLPGKFYSHLQTYYFNRTNYTCLLMGAGMGNFSSKLAIKMTGLGLQGNYPEGKVYLSTPFAQYHFHTLLYYLGLHVGAHSIANMPNSVYNQILGEYGLIGLLLFIVFYFGFFWKNRKKLRPLLPLLLLLLLLFEIEYWFEVLSLTIVFELMIFSELYTKTEHE